MGSRREPRKAISLPATVCGVDVMGRSFIETVKIGNISGRGALVESIRLALPIEPGSTVVVRCGENKSRFQVIWVAQLEGRLRKQLGLQHLLPSTLFWDLRIPLPAPDNYARPRLQVRRRHPRFSCELPAELRLEGSRSPLWASTGNVGEGGCFLQMLNVVPVGTRVDVALWLGDVKMWAQGIIVSVVRGFGMGIKFTAMSYEARLRLRRTTSEKGAQVEDRRLRLDEELARESAISSFAD
jgi:PilZ domain